ncbi:alpha/beta hydrolase [Paenibacillus sp. FSL H8-0048]|uniref:alpha/beta hydrolase n=1 Tax=Paenibacillus sp. FSL H8-0048 TaxID=2954508 RepID=UPI0030F817A2
MRSIRSFLVERLLFLNKKKINAREYMEQRRAINSLPYVLPVKLQSKYKIFQDHRFPVDTYVLKSASQADAKQILFIHGGGYIEQPLVWHWHFVHKLTQHLNSTVYVPVYPKAPNYQVMDAVQSVLSVYKHLLENGKPENIVIMGDSAGGGLSLAFAQYLSEAGLPQPGNIILLSPWLDITLSNPEIAMMLDKEPMLDWETLVEAGKRYAGDLPGTHYLVSPIYGKLTNLGTLTLFIGTHEFFLPDARKFRELASRNSVNIHYYEYPKMNHVFPVFPIPEAKKALKQIIDIIQR